MTKLQSLAHSGAYRCDVARSSTRLVMTALSHLAGLATEASTRKRRLAWTSLCGLVFMPLLSGCVVADPPQYEDPARTPPIPNLLLATPRIVEPYVLDRSDPSSSETMVVEVPVRSEDQGEKLRFSMFIDYTYPGARRVTGGTLPAGSLSDMSRKITLYVSLQGVEGCHALTLLIAHDSSFEDINLAPTLEAQNDAALVTWWVNALPSTGGDPNTFANCPNRSEVQKGN